MRPARADPNAGIFADFTGDGVIDYLCAVKNGFPELFAGQPGGKFPAPGKELRFVAERLRAPIVVSAGDMDRDGDLDVFIGQQKPGYQSGDIPTPYYDAKDGFPCYLLANDGKGDFHDVTAESGIGDKSLRRNFCASFVDLDEDGDLDLMLTSDFSGTDLFDNDGHGKFTDVSSQLNPRGYAFGMSHTFGDYNLDGQLDFVLIGMSSAAAHRLDYLKLGRDEFPDYNETRSQMGYGNRMYLRHGDGFVQRLSMPVLPARVGPGVPRRWTSTMMVIKTSTSPTARSVARQRRTTTPDSGVTMFTTNKASGPIKWLPSFLVGWRPCSPEKASPGVAMKITRY